MRKTWFAIVPLLLPSLPCLGQEAKPTEPAPPPQVNVKQEKKPVWTGGYTEEEFKAMHDLKQEKAPPLKGEMVEVGGARCYLTLPENKKPPLKAITVIHEWWGLNDHVKHWADRLAAAGYAALAVDLYGGKVATTPEEAMASMRAVEEVKAKAVLAAAHEFLAKDARVQAKNRASIGWCFGGGMSMQMALAHPDLDVAVIYYGRLETDAEKLKAVKAKVLGVFGSKDRSPSPEMVDAFEKGLNEAGIEHEIRRYDANHAFANPSGGRYDQKSAADAWARVGAFLEKNMK